MIKIITVLSAVAVCLTQAQQEGLEPAGKWSFVDKSLPLPSQWAKSFPTCGKGQQSPIDIQSSKTTTKRYPDRQNRNTRIEIDLLLQNTGEGFIFTYHPVGTNGVPYNKGGPFTPEHNYMSTSAYYFFGEDSKHGSAHKIDGQSYPMEYIGVKTYSEDNKKEIGAISVLYKLSEKDNPYLEPLINEMKNLKNPGDSVTLRMKSYGQLTVNPDKMVYESYRNNYYHYMGSWVTPDCEQPVNWVVLRDPNEISERQLNEMRQLIGTVGKPLAGRVRPTQPILATTTVYQSEPFSSDLPADQPSELNKKTA